MHFVLHALDHPNSEQRRLDVLDDHRAYLQTAPQKYGVEVLLSGPLRSDDGARMIGSFFLLDAPDRGALDKLFASDPMVEAELWKFQTISAVEIRQNRMSPSNRQA